ncbi:hypothetical protein B7P33_12665 [Sediminicola luteus]|uniref:Sulfatase N-terminal domain-containing protein n=2 Tax=Sediminicola luteus TaxID=319238 RepID=A0A2A4G6Z3_9FLAO|nr:hypothetical protein B7P33_12665 [Sediminicola luteus]
MIAIDDLNDFVSCMDGSIQIPTPNIDRLAAQGVLFTNAHCQAPICGPSRASIMTGLYPSTTGNYLQLQDRDIKKSNPAARTAEFIPDYFEKHGYQSFGVGKIFHQGDNAQVFDTYGGKNGFYGPRVSPRFHYDPALLAHKKGNTMTDWGAYPEHDSLMPDYKSTQWALAKLQEIKDQPFFMAVGYIRPHVPWYVPQKWFDRFPLDSIVLPPYLANDYDDIPAFAKRVTEAPQMPTTEEMQAQNQWKKIIQAYSACVAFVDHEIGKLLNGLEASEHAENTIVALWSDHGYHLGEKNRFAKQALWERDTRTVLIVKDGTHTHKTVTAPVQLVDLYPTLLELTGLPKKTDLDGRSLAPLIKRPNTIWPFPALSFYGHGNLAIRDHRFRLIRYADGSRELYDMKTDPNEWRNLAQDSNYLETINVLEEALPEHWADLSPFSKYNFNAYFRALTE